MVQSSLAGESSIIGAEDVLIPMLAGCGAAVQAPAVVRRMLHPPYQIRAGDAHSAALATRPPAPNARSRNGGGQVQSGW